MTTLRRLRRRTKTGDDAWGFPLLSENKAGFDSAKENAPSSLPRMGRIVKPFGNSFCLRLARYERLNEL
jgi:hypothetical protein